jgi:hypothetical protein
MPPPRSNILSKFEPWKTPLHSADQGSLSPGTLAIQSMRNITGKDGGIPGSGRRISGSVVVGAGVVL